jgi:DNA repair exonuclease SbcCD nuclease subunit
MTIRFIHTADWQLGMTRRYLSGEAQARFTQARVDAIRRIGVVAKEEGAAFIVVAGDVFETNQVEPKTVRRTLEALIEVSVPVYLLPGNHDPLDAASVYRSPTFLSKKPDSVIVLDDSVPRTPIAGIEVIGAPWMSKQALHDPVESVVAGLDPSPEILRVLVAHGAVRDPLNGGPAAIDVDKAEAAIADKRISYLALGDRHSTTSLGTSGRIYYSGSPEPTAYDEVDSGNVLVVELSSDGECTVRSRRVASWRFVVNDVALDSQSDVHTLGRWLDAQPDKSNSVVRLTLTGTISLSVSSELQGVLERHRDLFAAVEWTNESDLLVRPDDDDFSDMALTGFAAEAVGDLRATASGLGPQAQVANDALALLVRLASNGGVGQ